MEVRDGSEMLDARSRWSRLAPFASAFLIGFALAWLSPEGPEKVGLMLAAGALILATLVSLVAGVWQRFSEPVTLVPVVALCVAVDLMRAASGGGSAAGYGSLLLVPVIWQALRRRQLELSLTVVAVSLANIAAVVFLASPVSAAAQWRSVILFTVVSATIGQTVHRLVRDRAELLDQITALALIDPLTGLPNRRGWSGPIARELEQAGATGSPLTVAIVDLDRFKAYNDEHGHLAGDLLLAAASEAWVAALRSQDVLVRWGGEEFALLLPDTADDEARRVLDRLQRVTPGDQTFSAGFTVVRPDRDRPIDAERIMVAADQAMYLAKANGRARSESAGELEVDWSQLPAVSLHP